MNIYKTFKSLHKKLYPNKYKTDLIQKPLYNLCKGDEIFVMHLPKINDVWDSETMCLYYTTVSKCTVSQLYVYETLYSLDITINNEIPPFIIANNAKEFDLSNVKVDVNNIMIGKRECKLSTFYLTTDKKLLINILKNLIEPIKVIIPNNSIKSFKEKTNQIYMNIIKL